MATTTTLFTVLFFALLGSSIAAPSLTKRAGFWSDFTITNLSVYSVENGTSTLNFNLGHNTPTANYTGACSASWQCPHAVGTQIDCGGGAFPSIEAWNGPDDFSMEIKQSFRDPSVGQPDLVTVWAHGLVNQSEVACFECDSSGAGGTTCKEPSAAVITAPITSAIAKK